MRKKTRSHPLCEKAPVVAMILSMIILFTAKTLFSFMGNVVDMMGQSFFLCDTTAADLAA